jgi:NADH-quinone oxidoreductase subunit M
VVLSAIYVLWMYQRAMTGPSAVVVAEGAEPAEPVAVATTGVAIRDLGRREIGVLAPLMLALVLFGFYPMPLLDVSNPFSEQLLEHTGVNDDGPTVPVEAKTDGQSEAGH